MARSKRLAILSFLPFLVLAALFPLGAGGQAPVVNGAPVTVRTLAITAFKSGSSLTRFGKLEFLGGLVMASPNGELGAMSGIRMLPDGESFIVVMDTGYWADGRILRDDKGRLAGLSDFSISEMIGPDGFRKDRKQDMDAEGLALDGANAYVSFEVLHRIDTYPLAGYRASARIASQLPLMPPEGTLKSNGGLETLAMAPADGPLGGNLVHVAERSYNAAGDFFAGVLAGPRKGTFFVKRHAPYDITDGAFLPDGSLLLLERRFGLVDGIGTRIRRFNAADIKGQGETIDGEIVFEADYSHQIDNMEGIDVFKGPDGDTRILLISDDNHSLLERNLMLEFRLVE